MTKYGLYQSSLMKECPIVVFVGKDIERKVCLLSVLSYLVCYVVIINVTAHWWYPGMLRLLT